MKIDEVIKKTFQLTDIIIADNHGPGLLDGWDSVGHINLINAIETAYGITIDMDEAISLDNVSSIKQLLQKKGITEY